MMKPEQCCVVVGDQASQPLAFSQGSGRLKDRRSLPVAGKERKREKEEEGRRRKKKACKKARKTYRRKEKKKEGKRGRKKHDT